MSVQHIAIVGAGGQARELAWYIDEMNRAASRKFAVRGFVVSDLTKVGAHDSSPQIVGDYGWLSEHRGELHGLVLGIGTPKTRLKIAAELMEAFPELDWPVIAHPSATIDWTSAKVGRGVILGAGVVATVNLEIADFALLNFGCTVGHEARVGKGCVINPGANVSGGVTLGDGVLVGAGAIILQYRRVGSGATIGAGAVVTKDVQPETCMVGCPARPMTKR